MFKMQDATKKSFVRARSPLHSVNSRKCSDDLASNPSLLCSQRSKLLLAIFNPFMATRRIRFARRRQTSVDLAGSLSRNLLRDAAPSKPSPPSPRKLSLCPASTSRRRAELRAGLARTRSFARDAARTPPRAPAPSGKDAPRRRRTVSTETTASDDARLPRIARRPSARRRATATRARERATPSSLARGGFSRTRGERGAKWPASRVLSCRTKTRAASATRSVSRNNFTYDSRAGRVVTLPRRGSRSHPHPARRPRPRPRPIPRPAAATTT